MALATRCPACSTVFRIGTAQAAVKGGMVRCGACRNVFNSLDALVRVEDLHVIEEITIVPAAAPPLVGDALPAGSHGAVPPSPAAVPDADEPEADTHDGRTEPTLGAPADETADATADATPVEAADAAHAAPSDDDAVPTPWWLPDEPPRAAVAGPASTVDGAAAADAASDTASDTASRAPSTLGGPTHAPLGATTGRTASGASTGRATGLAAASATVDDEAPVGVVGTNPVFMRPEPLYEPAPRGMRALLGLLSFAAALALFGQLAYLSRDELAVRWPPARPWLAAGCRFVGCTVGYPVHAESITIESAAVQTLAPNVNTYVLTALLRNRDTIDLRYPTLELVLTDLQDRPILRRDLRPEDYLAGVVGHSAATGFPAQSELAVRVPFELTGLRFAGYRLNQLYP